MCTRMHNISACMLATYIPQISVIINQKSAVVVNSHTNTHTLTNAGQDDACMGGWDQHGRYGFAQGDMAYTTDT